MEENTYATTEETTQTEAASTAEDKAPAKNQEKKYSDADVNAIIDKKFAKWQKDYESTVAEDYYDGRRSAITR